MAISYPSTITVPTMNGCNLHQYGNEPGWLKEKLKFSFCFRVGLSQMPSLTSDTPEVDVCITASLFVQVTLVPTETVKLSRINLTISEARTGVTVEGVGVGVGIGVRVGFATAVAVGFGTGVRVGVAKGVGVAIGVWVGVAMGVWVGLSRGVRVGVAAFAAGEGRLTGRVAVGTGVGGVGISTTFVGAGRVGAGDGVGGTPNTRRARPAG